MRLFHEVRINPAHLIDKTLQLPGIMNLGRRLLKCGVL